MKYLQIVTIGILLILAANSQAEDIRHLHNDVEKLDRADSYKRILGFDYTSPTTQTEKALNDVMATPVIIDVANFYQQELPENIRVYASEGMKFSDLLDLMAVTYGYTTQYQGLGEMTRNKSIILNNRKHTLLELLEYLEHETMTNIVVWPKGTGATILVTDLNDAEDY